MFSFSLLMCSKFAPATCRFLLLMVAFIYIVAPKKAVFSVWYTSLTYFYISTEQASTVGNHIYSTGKNHGRQSIDRSTDFV